MRRLLSGIMAFCIALVLVSHCALAEEGKTMYSMAGYDTEDSKHVWDDNLFFRRMAEITGIDFSFQEYTNADDWRIYKSGLKADGELPDVLFKANLSLDEMIEMYEKGILIDLKPYLAASAPNLYALLQAHPDWEKAISLPDGAIVALPTINELSTNNAIWINQTWLNRLKLEMPRTADELTEVLRAFKTQDPNRNGSKDEVPLTFTGLWDLKFLAHAFGMIPNDYGIEVKDGKVIFDYTSDTWREFLKWLHDLYAEKLIDRDGFTTLDSSRAITDSKATINYGIVFGPTPMTMVPSSAVSDYQILVMEYEGEKIYREWLGEVTRGTFALTSHCKSPEALLKWVDYLYTKEGFFLACSGQLHDEYDVTSDGYWYWVDDVQTVQESILVDSTISEGTPMPLYMDAEYQMMFDDETTRTAVIALKSLHDVSKMPYPITNKTKEERDAITRVWSDLGKWIEVSMTWFVTGDVELNDQTWTNFVNEAKTHGADQIVQLFQDGLGS